MVVGGNIIQVKLHLGADVDYAFLCLVSLDAMFDGVKLRGDESQPFVDKAERIGSQRVLVVDARLVVFTDKTVEDVLPPFWNSIPYFKIDDGRKLGSLRDL